MKDLKAIRGLRHLQELIDQGEHELQDFKYMISDARKIARSISAFANNSGGRLLIGVKDNGTIAGVRSEEDVYMIEQAASRYCRPEVEVAFSAIKAGNGAVVIIATIPQCQSRPVSVVEEKGKLVAYYRVKDENVVAHPLMVEGWRRRATESLSGFITSGPEMAILSYLESISPATAQEEKIALGCHLSNVTTSRALARLAATGLVTFVHLTDHFEIALPDEEE